MSTTLARGAAVTDAAEPRRRFAGALRRLGTGPGAVVATLLPWRPELPVVALGALDAGCVHCPLSPSASPEPTAAALRVAGVAVLVTTERLLHARVRPFAARLPDLRFVVLVDGAGRPAGRALSFERLLDETGDGPWCEPGHVGPDDPATLHVVATPAGHPRGVVHARRAVPGFAAATRAVLDLCDDDDVVAVTLDPARIESTAHGLLGPLAAGAATVPGPTDPDRAAEVLAERRAAVWVTTPDVLAAVPRRDPHRLGAHLRAVVCAGAPDRDVATWWRDTTGASVRSAWGTADTGGFVLADLDDDAGEGVGRPLPGIEAAVLEQDGGGDLRPSAGPEADGELALRAGWPTMPAAYRPGPAGYAARFVDGWFRTGTRVRRTGDRWVLPPDAVPDRGTAGGRG